jgi:hypothetical protein
MKKNVGNLDKIIRIVLAVLIFAAGLYFGSWWGLAGFIPLLTGLVSSCPLYTCTGLNTIALKK